MAARATVEKRREITGGNWDLCSGTGRRVPGSIYGLVLKNVPTPTDLQTQNEPTKRDEQDWTEVTPAQAFAAQ
jgi:hypothetical protein